MQKLDFLLLYTPVACISREGHQPKLQQEGSLVVLGGAGGRGDVIKKYFTLRVPSTDTRSCLSDPKVDPNFGR